MKLNPLSSRVMTGTIMLVALVLLPFCGAAIADTESQQEVQPTETEGSERPIHPVMVEILALMDTQKAQLAELHTSLAETEDIDEIIRLHREIEKVKVLTEVEMFRVQLRHAEQIGNTDGADLLRQSIDSIVLRLEKEEEYRAELENSQR